MPSEVKNFSKDGKTYLAVIDALKASGISEAEKTWDSIQVKPDSIHLIENGIDMVYVESDTVNDLIKQLMQTKKISPFDKLLKGILEVPKK